ncbi:hypothetical protein [Flavobacterium sp.]|uniref:hypothetical protein n=1 Tax=Flavobacterium sp. TaxID=239 RepID=UPI0031E35060
MKQKILTLLFLLLIGNNYAQKIKIDKGEIKLDDKTVGYLEGKRPIYTIYNLDKSYAVTAELKSVPNEPSLSLPWIEIKDQNTGKFNELEFKNRSNKFSAFNYDRSVIYELLDRNYFTTDGLNKEEIEKFLNSESAGISDKRLGVQNSINEANKIADTYQLSIDDAGTIYSIKAQNPDPLDKRIGYIKVTTPVTNGEVMYEVMDLDNYLIATWYAKAGMISGYNKFLNQKLVTFDNKIFKATFDNSGNPMGYKMSKDITAMNIVRVLVGNGYILQHQGISFEQQKSKEQAKVNLEKYETAKLNSINIYDKTGYVINEKGEKITGVFKIEFEEISKGNNSSNNSFVPGQKLYKTTDDFATYQSKSGVRFCIDESKECFIGLSCKGGNFLSSGIRALNADNSAFYKILYENEGLMVLAYPKYLNELIIKIPTQETGLFTTKVGNSKLKKNVTDYLKCDSFVFENYDFKTLEGLIKVLEDYKSSCIK